MMGQPPPGPSAFPFLRVRLGGRWSTALKSAVGRREPDEPRTLGGFKETTLHPARGEHVFSPAFLEGGHLLLLKKWQFCFSLSHVLKVKTAFGERTSIFLLNAILLITAIAEMETRGWMNIHKSKSIPGELTDQRTILKRRFRCAVGYAHSVW